MQNQSNCLTPTLQHKQSMAGGQPHLHMTKLCSAVTQVPSSAKFLLGGNCGFWNFIFSIFTENFDHWLPRLTNESADRVTCVAPPAPTPPATRLELEKICTTDCGRPGWRPTRTAGLTGKTGAGPGRRPSAPVSYGTVRLSVSLCVSLSLPTGSPGLGVSRILWGGR